MGVQSSPLLMSASTKGLLLRLKSLRNAYTSSFVKVAMARKLTEMSQARIISLLPNLNLNDMGTGILPSNLYKLIFFRVATAAMLPSGDSAVSRESRPTFFSWHSTGESGSDMLYRGNLSRKSAFHSLKPFAVWIKSPITKPFPGSLLGNAKMVSTRPNCYCHNGFPAIKVRYASHDKRKVGPKGVCSHSLSLAARPMHVRHSASIFPALLR